MVKVFYCSSYRLLFIDIIGQVKNGNIIAQKAKNTKKSMINSNYIQPCTRVKKKCAIAI
jgi:hypothetical protein